MLQEQDSPHVPAGGGKGKKFTSAAFSGPIWYQMDTLTLTQDGPSSSGPFPWSRALQTWQDLWDGTFGSPPFPQVKGICFHTPKFQHGLCPLVPPHSGSLGQAFPLPRPPHTSWKTL